MSSGGGYNKIMTNLFNFFSKARRLAAAFLLAILLVWAALTGMDLSAAQEDIAPSDLILVGIAPEISQPEALALFADQGMTLVHFWPAFELAAVRPAVVGRASGATVDAAMARAQSLPAVRFAELDGRIEAAQVDMPFIPDDPNYPQQWGLPMIGMPTAWNLTEGDPSIVIAVIDSGMELTHDDLSMENVWTNPLEVAGQPGVDDDNNGFVDDLHGWDWVEGNNNPNDLFGHGTHVAGILVAAINNGVGVAGMGANLRVMPLRVLDGRGHGAVSDLISALDYARRQGAQIINLSLVLRSDSLALREAVERLYADGILIVAATGNYGNQVYWPAAYTQTLAVAAVDREDLWATFSITGSQTDVAAPGADVLSTYKSNSYYNQSGTSMAVPHVSALAGLIWSLRPDLNRAGVVDLILSTAVDVNAADYPGPDPYLGRGRIDAAAALNQAAEALYIDIQLPAGAYLSVGQPFQIPIRVTVTDTQGAPLPIRGGIVGVELRGPSAGGGIAGATGARVAGARLISDENGYAFFDVTLPQEAGQYTLVVANGAHVQTLVLRIQDGPLLLSIQPSSVSMTVGAGQIDIFILARTGGDQPYTDDLRITLRTSRGRFAHGSQMITTIMDGGVLTQTLYAGEVAGTAEVTIEVANQTHRITLLVKPGTPYRLSGPSEIFGLNFGKGVALDLHLTLYDRFGNQVWESYPVNFYSLAGLFSPQSTRAINGEVSTRFEIGPWASASQPIWAMIPGTFAIYRAEVKLLSEHYYFPMVFGE
jgi:subtilisin family serine protease